MRRLRKAQRFSRPTGATIIRRVTIPIVMPAILSTFLLIFSSGFSSYTVPVFLGSAVKCYTLSTKMRALIQAGYQGQGYIIAFVSILLGCLILGVNQHFTGKRKSFTTVTGKSGQVSLVKLRKANWPISIVLIVFTAFFAIMPLISFALESVIRQPGNYSLSNMTLHFWIGTEDSAYETGMIAGILLNTTMWSALLRQVLLALVVAAIVGTCGMLIGYACVRRRGSRLSRMVESLAFFPYLMPAMAFATIYLAVATSANFKFLYGTFGVLVLVASIKFLPFASRSGVNSMMQIAPEIEEAAVIFGVPWAHAHDPHSLPDSKEQHHLRLSAAGDFRDARGCAVHPAGALCALSADHDALLLQRNRIRAIRQRRHAADHPHHYSHQLCHQ